MPNYKCPHCGNGLAVTLVWYRDRDENTASCSNCGWSCKVWQLEDVLSTKTPTVACAITNEELIDNLRIVKFNLEKYCLHIGNFFDHWRSDIGVLDYLITEVQKRLLDNEKGTNL